MRGTSSGTIAENTGQRNARPMPLAKTNTSSHGAVIIPEAVAAHSAIAVAASQNWVATSQRRRSRMSASAPLGRPRRNTGKVDADWTSATQIGVLVKVVIVHAAATSFIHMHRFAVSQVLQSSRNTGTLKGSNAVAERGDVGAREGSAASSGGIDDMEGRLVSPIACPGRWSISGCPSIRTFSPAATIGSFAPMAQRPDALQEARMTQRGDREEDVWLSDAQLAQLARADEVDHLHSPVPTRMVSNGEHMPIPQTAEQKRVERRIERPGRQRRPHARAWAGAVFSPARAGWRRAFSP